MFEPSKKSRSFQKSLTQRIWTLREIGIPIDDADPSRYEEYWLPSENYETTWFDFEEFEAECWSDEQEQKLRGWIESIQTEETNFGWGDPVNGFERLAWYLPISNHGLNSRIFITDIGIAYYARRILKELDTQRLGLRHRARVSFIGAIHLLLKHEMFHHRVEWHAFRIFSGGHSVDPNLYSTYEKNVYRPALLAGSDDLLEEALANAFAFHEAKTADFGHVDLGPAVIALRAAEVSSWASSPPGYRAASNFKASIKFKMGKLLLSKWLSKGKLDFAQIPLEVSSFDIQSSPLERGYADNWNFVITRQTQPTLPHFSFTVRTKDLEPLLRDHGYSPTDRGAGSHQVWGKAGAPIITLPYRKDQEGNEVLKSTAKTLGYSSVRDLIQAVRSR